MKKENLTHNIMWLIVAFGSLFVSCDYDNFEDPDATIKGMIVDSKGELVPTQEPNGTRIRLYEENYENDDVQPIAFWGKQDGSFEYSRIFSGNYRIIADGPFFPIDTSSVMVENTKQISIEVEPFLKIDIANTEKTGNDLIVNYSISRTNVVGKINQIAVFVSTTPFVDSNNYINSSPEIDVSNIEDDEILTTSYNQIISELEEGNKYYVRAAARAANSGNYYNYSNLIEIDF